MMQVTTSTNFDGKIADWLIITTDKYKIGLIMNWGGVLGYFSVIGSNYNTVNANDPGREIQQSYYSPDKFIDDEIVMDWPWNPVQGGNGSPRYWSDEIEDNIVTTLYGNVVDYSYTENQFYFKAVPRLWLSIKEDPECYMEQWITFVDDLVHIHYKFTYTGTHTRTGIFYEAPALWLNQQLPVFAIYDGNNPWTGNALTEPPPDNPIWMDVHHPTENWGALLNTSDWGLGVYTLGTNVDGGYWGAFLMSGSSYMTPVVRPMLTLNTGSTIEHDAVYTLGNITQIRDRFHARHLSASPRSQLFATPFTVTLSNDEPIGPIYYTTDGTEPTAVSSQYSTPITISDTTTLKFTTENSLGNLEVVRTETYTLNTTTSVSLSLSPVTLAASVVNSTITSVRNVIVSLTSIAMTLSVTNPIVTEEFEIGVIVMPAIMTMTVLDTEIDATTGRIRDGNNNSIAISVWDGTQLVPVTPNYWVGGQLTE